MPHANTDEAPLLADSSAPESTARELAGQLITFMESGTPPEGLFTADVFCDFTMPQWRLQSQGIDDLVAMRKAGHAGPSSVPRPRGTGPHRQARQLTRPATARLGADRWRVPLRPGSRPPG